LGEQIVALCISNAILMHFWWRNNKRLFLELDTINSKNGKNEYMGRFKESE